MRVYLKSDIREFFSRRPSSRPDDWETIKAENIDSGRQRDLSIWISGYCQGRPTHFAERHDETDDANAMGAAR
jgi:hypothetical protein